MKTWTRRSVAAMAILATFLLSWTTAQAHRMPLPTSTVQIADETMLTLLSAGTNANAAWHALPQERQDAILRSMFPDEFARGMRPELMAAYNPASIETVGMSGQRPDAPE